MNNRIKRSIRGFSLISTLVAASLLSLLVAVGVYAARKYDNANAASQKGEIYLVLLDAATKYAKKNQAALLNKQPISGFNNILHPEIDELKAGGFLPQQYSDNLPDRFGGKLKPVIEYETPGCPGANCVLAVKINPTGPVKDSNNNSDTGLASAIALKIGTAGWTNSTQTDMLLEKNGAKIKSPLPMQKAVVVAANWIPSTKPLATNDIREYETVNCPAPQLGQIVRWRMKSTDKNGNVTYTAWIEESNTCFTPTCSNGATNFPVCNNNVCSNGATNFPVCNNNVCSNGATNYPACTNTNPQCTNGATNYPTCNNNVCQNGATNYPACNNVCLNGAGNWPACNDNNPQCSNGATNYPFCTNNPGRCTNGATNYPDCDNNTDNHCTNGATNWPACNNNTPSTCTNGATNYPACNNNVCTNGATNYPACNNNVCTNGATNYPACNNICFNGATNYPACDNKIPSTCSNGATNYPFCDNGPQQCPPGGPQTPTCACPSGFVWDATKQQCVLPKPENPVCEAPYIGTWPNCYIPTCPPGGPQNYPVCACNPGTTWNGNSCISIPPQRETLTCTSVHSPGGPGRVPGGTWLPLDPNADYLNTPGHVWQFYYWYDPKDDGNRGDYAYCSSYNP